MLENRTWLLRLDSHALSDLSSVTVFYQWVRDIESGNLFRNFSHHITRLSSNQRRKLGILLLTPNPVFCVKKVPAIPWSWTPQDASEGRNNEKQVIIFISNVSVTITIHASSYAHLRFWDLDLYYVISSQPQLTKKCLAVFYRL